MNQAKQPDGTTAVELSCAGRPVARYVWQSDLEDNSSPRPYLHPIYTLAGTRVTGFRPPDHPHHLGASIAIPVLNEVNFWGGRTYVRDTGSVPLNNHGAQRHVAWSRQQPDHLVEQLEWNGPDGAAVAGEYREITVSKLSETAWALGFEFRITPVDGAIRVESPGVRGRTGAGYGGFFWRAPENLDRVVAFGPESSAVHGKRLPWVALSGNQPGGAPWTLIFQSADASQETGVAQASVDPWFVRAEDYAGVCAALAWQDPLEIPESQELARRINVVVADGNLTPEQAERSLRVAGQTPAGAGRWPC
jgi:hypothetical protein